MGSMCRTFKVGLRLRDLEKLAVDTRVHRKKRRTGDRVIYYYDHMHNSADA